MLGTLFCKVLTDMLASIAAAIMFSVVWQTVVLIFHFVVGHQALYVGYTLYKTWHACVCLGLSVMHA